MHECIAASKQTRGNILAHICIVSTICEWYKCNQVSYIPVIMYIYILYTVYICSAQPCLRTVKYIHTNVTYIQAITVIARSKNDDFVSVDTKQIHARTHNYKSCFAVCMELFDFCLFSVWLSLFMCVYMHVSLVWFNSFRLALSLEIALWSNYKCKISNIRSEIENSAGWLYFSYLSFSAHCSRPLSHLWLEFTFG